MMSRFKQKPRRMLAIVFAFILVMQTVIGQPGLFVSANDAEKSALQVAIENYFEQYESSYADSETAEMALATAKAQVQAVINANESGASCEISNGSLALYAKGGTYSFTATVTLTDSTSFTTDTLSMKIAARPEPVAVVFDDAETVAGVAFKGHLSEPTFVGGEKKYMHVAQNSAGNNFTYTNFVEQSGLEKLDYDKYPYLKLSFKSNDITTWNGINLYFGSDLATYYAIHPYELTGNGTDIDWKEVLVDMRTGAYTMLKGTGVYGTIDTGWKTGTDSWSGTGRVEIRFSDQNVANEVDLEYVAFFATEAQAKAYPGVPDDSVDNSMAILSSSTFACDGDVASTQPDAHNVLENKIQALNLETQAYTLENGFFVAPTKSSAGSYTVDVVFSTGDTVTVTMQITAIPLKPIIWTFDNSSILSQFTADNADMKYENGYVKMTTQNTGNADGFFLQGAPKSDESFDISELPYVKLKYKISGAADAPVQFYYWLNNSNTASRHCFSGNDPDWEGDTVTVIANLSVHNTDETAVWIENIDKPEAEPKKLNFYDAYATANTGNVTKIRLNLARDYHLNRMAEVEYVGFFPTLADAKAYDGAAQERINAAVATLNAQKFDIKWGEGYDRNRVIDGVKFVVEEGGVGCTNVGITDYTAPSEDKEGSVTFDATIKSADKKATITKTVKIGKKPSEPIVWRFNNSEILSKLRYDKVSATIEDNVAKLVSTNPSAEDGFYFFADTPGVSDAFYLEDYPYIRIKYKRDGVAPGQLYFYSDKLSGDPVIQPIGYGTKSGDWYTSIIDTVVRNNEDPMVYSTHLKTGVEEEYVLNSMNKPSTYPWRGLSTTFRFNFARRGYLDRTMYLEYIAFFPTLEDAREYAAVEEDERLKANAQLALQSYSGSSDVSYYEGYEEKYAKETACDIISEVVGDEVKVIINTVSHTAPKGTTNGTYQFTADICNLEGKVLYKTSTYTLNISYEKDTEPVVFTFTNPAFIKRATSEDGTSIEANGYVNMTLKGEEQTSFALMLKAGEKFHMEGHPFIAFNVNAESTSNSIILNGTEYTLDINISGETVVVIDTTTGKIYVGRQEVSGVTVTIPKEKILSLGMKFADTEVTVSYMAFFADLSEALNYTGESAVLQEAITDIQSKAQNLKCAYADAKTKEDAMAFLLKQISAAMGTQVSFVSTECTDYVAAHAGTTGSITVTMLIGAGSQCDSHYGYVTVTMTIGKKPSAPVVWKFTQNFMDTYIQKGDNVTLSLQNDALIMDSVSDTVGDGFYFVADGSSVGSEFYLQDYPYVKMKYRYHGEGSWMGTSYFYFGGETEGYPYRSYSIGEVANSNIWCSALLDMNDNTITLCDLDNNIMLSETAMDGTADYHGGTPSSFRVNMGRNAYTTLHAEIEYIAFFSSREEAEAYNNDYYYSAYEFNGVEYAKAEDELESAPLTIETVIHPTTGQKAEMTVLSNSDYSLETTADGNVRFVYNGTEVLTSSDFSDLNVFDGKWHQIAVTLQANKALLYVDNQVVDTEESFTVSDEISLQAPLLAKDDVSDTPFVGNIYYVRLYNNVQTAEQLAASAFSKTVADEEALLAGWFMDKLTNEGQFADVCGNNPMTLMDNYDLAYEGHEFMGNDYVKTEKSLTAEPKTFEFWMKSPKSVQTGTYTILSNKTEGSSTYTEIQLVDGQLRMVYNGSTLFTTTGISFADNIWKHVAVTLGDTTQLYVDGELQKTNSETCASGSSSQNPYYIGAGLESKKTPFVGKLSDVRIWSSVRTQTEIKENMQDYLADTARTEKLLGSWKLDTQNYLKYTDDSSNKNTGTLYSAGWYKLENITGDYTLGAIGDTQSFFSSTTIVTRFEDTFEKLAEKINDFNMKYLFHLGDITQNDTLMEYRYARTAYDRIEGKIPYAMILGNHDYPSPSSGIGAEFRNSSNFNEVFPVSTFKNQTFENSRFGGAYDEDDAANVYSFLEVGDTEYIIFSLECGPRDEILEWTSKILDQYSEKCAIILTHVYFTEPDGIDDNEGERTDAEYAGSASNYGEDFKTANNGDDIWEKLVSKHDNIGLVLCGHSQNKSINYLVSEGDYGNDVVELMVDHSAMVEGFPSDEGLMTLLSFDEETGQMHTYWYSPFYDAYYSTENEVTFDMSDNLVKKDREEYFSDEVYKLEDFRSGDTFTYPDSKEFGYVFAGWYDPETKQPIATTVKSGDAVAKFVDSDVLSVKMQAGLTKLDDDTYVIPEDETKIRFVTTVDSLEYREVAFMISTQKSDGTYTTPKSTVTDENSGIVYTSLYYIGKDSGDTMDYSPTVFSPYSEYFKTYTLNGIPRSAYGTNIKVTPYWETLDGTTVYGKERTICVNDIIKGYSER